jgi:hypothetical protein
MPQTNDLSRSLTTLDQDSTLIAVVELSQSSWLVAGIVPGIERHPAKKLEANEVLLLSLLHRWREEAAEPGERSRGSRLRSRRAATASGWPAGCGRAASKPMSFMRPASPSRASIAGRRVTASMQRC